MYVLLVDVGLDMMIVAVTVDFGGVLVVFTVDIAFCVLVVGCMCLCLFSLFRLMWLQFPVFGYVWFVLLFACCWFWVYAGGLVSCL